MTSPRIVHVAPASSVGIHRYARQLVDALRRLDVDAELAESDPRDGRHAHFHLGNSTRGLYPQIRHADRPSVVSLHDVVPRLWALRPVLVPYQNRLLAPHMVIVHSRYAQELLSQRGFRGQSRVNRFGIDVALPAATAVERLRAEVSPDGRPILVLAGILNTQKGIPALIREAAHRPEFVFLLAGKIGDRATRDAVRSASENVVVIGGDTGIADYGLFITCIASGDVLLNFRSGSVGESSGPVAEAHALGTPVAGYAVGSLPEYCGDQDVLFAPGTPIADALASLAARTAFERIPADSPVNRTLGDAGREALAVYAEMGWL